MCTLRVSGKQFNVDRFLATSDFQPSAIWRRGQKRWLSSNGVSDVSGFNLGVSNASWNNLQKQIKETLRFLKKYKNEVMRLRQYPGVESLELDFPINNRMDRKRVYSQCDYLTKELIHKAGQFPLSIEISRYPHRIKRNRSRKHSKLIKRP